MEDLNEFNAFTVTGLSQKFVNMLARAEYPYSIIQSSPVSIIFPLDRMQQVKEQIQMFREVTAKIGAPLYTPTILSKVKKIYTPKIIKE